MSSTAYVRAGRKILCALAAWIFIATVAYAPVDRADAMEPTQRISGRPVGEVLDGLRSQGFTFIYNTRLVPPEMRVEAEPNARSGVELATEILARHGLSLSRVTPGVFAVVPGVPDETTDASKLAPSAAGEARVEEVFVQASRYALESEFSPEQALLTHDDIESLPSLGEEPLRSVQRLPGIASNGFSSLGAVRGGEPNETAILLDGLRLYEPFHLKNFLSPVSLLDARLIQSMQVYSGGFPVIYGDRMSAIVDAASLDPTAPRYYEAGLSLFHANVLASAQFDEGAGRGLISFRRSNLSELAQLSEREFGKPEYLDGFAKVDYRLNDATRLSAKFLASNDRIVAIRDSRGERADAEYRNNYLWGTIEHDWDTGAQSRVVLSYTDINNERDGRIDEIEKRSAHIRDYRNFHVVGLRADHEFEWLGLQHRMGLEARRLWGSYDYRADVRFDAGFPFPDSPAREVHRVATPKPDGFESGAWWDGRIEFGERWTMQAGLRVDTQTYDGSGDHEQIAPRVSVLYALNDATRIRATWGRFYQSHAINELQVEDGIERFHGAQHADHLILSIDRTLRQGLDLRIEAYRKQYRDVAPRFENLFNPLVLLPETEFDRVMVAPSSARAEGVELFLRWQSAGPWRAWINYTWSQVEDVIDGRNVPRSWDQEHAINAGLGWASGAWSVTLADSFHTGWPITRLRLVETPEGGLQPTFGARNADRLGNYNALDLRINRTYALSRGALDLFLEVTNLLSRENECCIEYSITRGPAGAPVLDEEVDHWLRLVPSIGVLWRY
jgi:hypothetical protein